MILHSIKRAVIMDALPEQTENIRTDMDLNYSVPLICVMRIRDMNIYEQDLNLNKGTTVMVNQTAKTHTLTRICSTAVVKTTRTAGCFLSAHSIKLKANFINVKTNQVEYFNPAAYATISVTVDTVTMSQIAMEYRTGLNAKGAVIWEDT